MAAIKNLKTTIVTISTIVTALIVSTVVTASVHIAFADETIRTTKNVDNTGINVQTHTDEKKQCDTAGGSSGIGGGFGRFGGTCSAFSADNVTQSGGKLTK
jgi:hypothetical protein